MEDSNSSRCNIHPVFRDTIITSVVPGDYDGDSQMDVLVTAQPLNSNRATLIIFWAFNQTLGTVVSSHCCVSIRAGSTGSLQKN